MINFLKQHKKTIAGILAVLGIGGGSVKLGSNLGAATSDSYQLVTGVKGYVTKTDPTNLAPDYLVAGSQNVIINDQEKIESRSGYELFGVASTTATPITSDYSWRNSGATSTLPSEIMLRTSGNFLEFYATSTFETLATTISTSSPVRFASVWSSSELMDVLLFVNASSTLMEWSGGRGSFASDTTNTITINETIGESRFYSSGTTKQLRVKDNGGVWRTFNYTGFSGSQFTGVTPDPTTFTIPNSSLVVQAIRYNINTPSPGYTSDVIKVLNNQVWVGSADSRVIYVSKDSSYTDFSFSSPRISGDGAKLTLDDTTVGLESPDDKQMLVFSGKDRVYKVIFDISPGSSNDREVPVVTPLLVSSGQGAVSQELISKIKQSVIWVSNNKELVELGQVQNLPGPQAVSISDPIKPDFINADFTNGDIEFWRNSIFITAPSSGKLFIFDLAKRFWQPPQIIGIRRLTQYNDALYGHSQSIPESYTLFTGLSDNNNPISFKVHYAYVNSGRRDILKNFDRFFTELYLASNTKLTVSILYEWKGSKGITSYVLDGSDSKFLYVPVSDASLGVNSLGTNPLGSTLNSGEDTPKYRRFKPIIPTDNFEYQIRLETEDGDAAFQVLSVGSNSRASGNLPAKISQ